MSEFKNRLRSIELDKISSLSRPIDFTFNPLFYSQITECEKIEKDGKRHYSVNGELYPSVTTVIGATKSKASIRSLENWKKQIGEAEADKIKNKAALRGTNLHNLCENFILRKDFILPDSSANEFALWKQMYPLLKRLSDIHVIEGVLYSTKLKIAGKADCIARFDGVLSVIDFKSARKEKTEEQHDDYFCQETAYGELFKDMHGVEIKQIVTLFAYDGDFHSKSGTVVIKNPDDYKDMLYSRINSYKKTLDLV